MSSDDEFENDTFCDYGSTVVDYWNNYAEVYPDYYDDQGYIESTYASGTCTHLIHPDWSFVNGEYWG